MKFIFEHPTQMQVGKGHEIASRGDSSEETRKDWKTKGGWSWYYLLIALLILFLSSCESTALYTSENNMPRGRATQPQQRQTSRVSGNAEYMVASWYGNEFHGRATASGEIFNMYDFTAAHRTLPFGTKLRLKNEETNKEVIVTINDRGPVSTERDIDVSYRVAQELDFVNAGIMRLRVEFLD
ncbi:MAG: septal ring lytic transglycosylase RlpA family protein [Candidatus Cloacimonetes bacterium]|nr:septal ring lytic transglycosylase RlpA family protein [Candidatus Cloacimonadota bacterium]